jgi:SAM-dependent methyltransferase
MLKQQSVVIPRWISWQMHLASRTKRHQDYPPAIGQIDFGELRQTQVLGRDTDSADSQAVENYYIAQFLRREARVLKGRALEIGKDHYTSVVAGRDLTITSLAFTDDTELIHRVADMKDNAYDVLLLVQVLQLIYDLHAVVRHIHRILVPGGILLATVPGTCYAAGGRVNEMKPYWGFTNVSLRKLIESVFPARRINTDVFGNVLVATAHLYGLGVGELTPKELNFRDNHYPLLLTLKAQKASACRSNN